MIAMGCRAWNSYKKKSWTNLEFSRSPKDFALEISGFDEELRSLSQSRLLKGADQLATGPATHLSDGISSALGRIPTDEKTPFLLVLSDGRDSQSESVLPAAALANNRKVPIYTVSLGDQIQQSDLAVLAVPMQDSLLPGEPGAILVKIYQVGFDRSETTLTVGQGDDRQQIPISFNHKRPSKCRFRSSKKNRAITNIL